MRHARPRPDLENAAARIVQSLGGIWRREGAMCHCPVHEDRRPSLSVRVGTSSLLFKCFAGCDAVDVIREIRRRRFAIPADHCGGRIELSRRSTSFSDLARKIWEEALPISGTPAARYLASRGIDACPSSLRYHPAAPLGPGRAVRFRPALIAAVCQRNGLVSVQRAFLNPAGNGLAGDLAKPKLTLGRPLKGAVKLVPANTVLGLAEGVESALSAIQLTGIPTWATLGSERLPLIDIPASVRRLILLPDADASGRVAEFKAREAYAGLNLEIETIWPWYDRKDWNDVLRLEGKGEAERVRHPV